MGIQPFRFWCQHVLPAVYDDSLSYYELLCKVVAKLNETISLANTTSDGFEQLTNYVNTYFDDLNVQNQINNKLDSMAQSGELAEIINEQIFNELTSKIGENTASINEINENIGGINTNINELNENIDIINTNIEGINGNINELENNNKFYRDTFRFYLDGVNGDDNNDGRTRVTPFKTIEKVLNYLTESADTRCYIIAPGIYTINKNVLTSCAIHITAEVENVELRWTANNPCIYSSHINLACSVAGAPNAQMLITAEQEGPYFEGCTTTITNVNFDIPNLITYGGTLYSNGITIRRATFNSTKVRFVTYTNILNTETTANALYIDRGSDFSIRDTLSIQPLGSDGTGCIIYCRQSNIRVYASPNAQTNYKNGVGITYGIALMRENVKNGYANNSREGNNFETPSLVISNAGTI